MDHPARTVLDAIGQHGSLTLRALHETTKLPLEQLRTILMQLEQTKQVAFHSHPFRAWEHTWTLSENRKG